MYVVEFKSMEKIQPPEGKKKKKKDLRPIL